MHGSSSHIRLNIAGAELRSKSRRANANLPVISEEKLRELQEIRRRLLSGEKSG